MQNRFGWVWWFERLKEGRYIFIIASIKYFTTTHNKLSERERERKGEENAFDEITNICNIVRVITVFRK
jgi:hypothetical protein